jgi:hypothetical protein
MGLIVRGYKYKASRLLGLSFWHLLLLSPGGWHLKFCHYCYSPLSLIQLLPAVLHYFPLIPRIISALFQFGIRAQIPVYENLFCCNG